ncbi:MAG: universal stress protein [Pseudomonadota bacterium]
MSSSAILKFLFAVDGSDQAQAAVEFAAKFLPPDRLEPVIFHIAGKAPEQLWDLQHEPTPFASSGFSNWESEAKKDAENFLEKAEKAMVQAGVPEKRIRVVVRDRSVGIARDLLAEALSGYDAVVMGRTGTNKLKELVLGGVANKLLGKLTDATQCVVSGDPSPHKVLLAVDASEGAAKALEFLASLAGGVEKEVVIFHAIRHFRLPPYLLDLPEMSAAEDRLIKEQKDAVRPILEEYRQRLAETGFNPNLIRIKIAAGVASRAEAIIEETKKNGIGSIFIGRRGLSRVEQFFMGRVSSKVVQLARNAAIWVVG